MTIARITIATIIAYAVASCFGTVGGIAAGILIIYLTKD